MKHSSVYIHCQTVRMVFAAAFLLLSAIPLRAADFNPDEALGFLETMTTLDMKKPDINILARLFKARNAVGLHNDFVEHVEWCVCAGVVAAGRSDLYSKHLKAGCKAMNAEAFEEMLTRQCPDCTGANSTVKCQRCNGTGQCASCGGRGNRGEMKDLEGKTRTIKCGTCKGSGRCPLCNGHKTLKKTDCSKCLGTHRIWDKEVALEEYENRALGSMYHLCTGAEATELPDIIRGDFAKARKTAEAKFGAIREVRENEKAKARKEQERQEQAERRRIRQEQAERERIRQEQAESQRPVGVYREVCGMCHGTGSLARGLRRCMYCGGKGYTEVEVYQ